MEHGRNQLKPGAAILTVAVLLCLSPGFFTSAEAASPGPAASKSDARDLVHVGDHASLLDRQSVHPGTPMVLNPITGAFDFDLGGSETRKLQLQLSYPLTLEAGHTLRSSATGSSVLGLGALLRVPLGNGLSVDAGAKQVLGNSQFQSLGNIQCLNGTLGPDFYTASGCRFVTDPGSKFDRRTLSLGASHEFGNVTTSVNWFNTSGERSSTGLNKLDQFNPSALLIDNRLMSAPGSSSLLPGFWSADYSTLETTGIDLNFQVGFATSRAGEIRLGLALTRVLDASYQGIYGYDIGPLDLNSSEAYDSAALGIEWSRGSFSSGIRGYYREPVSFLDNENLESTSTFDVHFTWRAPWNANLSVGASNVLGAGVSDRNSLDKTTDRFESIYGRIPYVRYQQDL